MLKTMMLAALLLLSHSTLHAQNALVSTYSSTFPSALQTDAISAKQGLTSRQLHSAVQDKYGFLWFGSQNGLFRWDGVAMTAFMQQSGDTTTLPSNTIFHLHQDKQGTLWVATAAGLARFHRNNNTFSTVIADKPVTDIHEDSHGTLWCWIHTATTKADEICTFEAATGRTAHFKEGAQGLRSAYLYALLEDKSGTIWLGTSNGLHRFDRAKETFTVFLADATSPTSPAKAPNAHIHSLAEDASGTLLVGTGNGLLQCTDRMNTRFEAYLSANSVNSTTTLLRESGIFLLRPDRMGNIFAATMQRVSGSATNQLRWCDLVRGAVSAPIPVLPLEGKAQSHRCATDAEGQFWWGVGNGVVRLNPTTMQAEVPLGDQSAPNRINAPVSAVVADKAGIVWFARLKGGVSKILPALQAFHTLPFVAGTSSQTLLSPNVSALAESPDGALWIGYIGGAGASRLDRTTMTMTHFRQEPSNPASLRGYDGETNVYAFYGDTRGAWWIGSYLLERLNRSGIESNTGSGFTHIPLVQNEVVPATAMIEDSDGNFWIGSTFGLALMNTSRNAIEKRFVNKPSDNATLGNNNIHVLFEDRAKTLWIGHDGGVDTFHRTTKRFSHVRATTSDSSNLISGAVTTILEDKQGRLWIGTRTGLNLFDRTTKTVIRTLTRRDGLPENGIAGLCEDSRGHLWISTRRGLCRFSPETNEVLTFSSTDGIADEEFSEGAAHRTRDGKLWFGARSAITYFHPDSIYAPSTPNRAVITHLKKFGERAQLDEYIADAKGIELGYDDKIIALEYAALGALHPEKAQFSYKLDGLDTAWVIAGSEREAKYTSLPAGTYTFFVKAASSNGVWQQTPTQLTITVRPPWWRTWWFIVGGVLICGVVGFLLYKQRVRTIEAQNLSLQRLVDERTQLLKEANLEVNRQLGILSEQAKDIEIANSHLQEANTELDNTVNELKETQTQLVQSERINAAGMLTAGVMHEINNPNASIHSALELAEQQLRSLQEHFLSLLDEESRTSDDAKGFVGMIQKVKDIIEIALTGSDRIRGIVIALQGFTKYQNDGKTNNNVAQEIHATATIFQYQFKDVVVEENISHELHIKAQWAEINQAILNLLINAAQAGATRIRIIAEDTPTSPYVHFRIADNGGGMSKEIQNRIFEPFYTTKSVENSGLGLSITRQIIDRHNGTISVESESGKGTTFVIALPKQVINSAVEQPK